MSRPFFARLNFTDRRLSWDSGETAIRSNGMCSLSGSATPIPCLTRSAMTQTTPASPSFFVWW